MSRTISAVATLALSLMGCQSEERPIIAVRGEGDVNMFVPFQIRSPQDMQVFLENRWTLERVRAFCEPTRILPFGHQNLTGKPGSTARWSIELHPNTKHEFDRIYWYGFVKEGKIVASSMNVEKGDLHWVLEWAEFENIEVKLPQDYPYIELPK